jgi:hypothetical protein
MYKDLIESHRWYEENRERIVSRYNGRYVVLAGCSVVADYATEDEALSETLKTRPYGTFIVKKCVPKSEERPPSFHSRVAFV